MKAEIAGRTADDAAQQRLSELAFAAYGIPRGTPVEVIVVGGKTGIVPKRQPSPAASVESPNKVNTDTFISGQGRIGEMAKMSGMPEGTPFEVAVVRGATVFRRLV